MKKISVIIPIYKGKQYIPGIIRMLEENGKSLNNIEPAEIEAVFVNDFPEEALGPIEPGAGFISLVIVENKENRGIHFSRVQGFLRSKGEYVLFLDQDDTISPVCLREQLKELHHYDAVICNGKNYSDFIYRNPAELKRAVHEKEYKRGFNRIVAPGQVLLRRNIVPPEWLHHILQNNGADDYFLWLLLFSRGSRIGIQEKALYWHQISDVNTSHHKEEMYRSVCEMTEIMEGLDYLTQEEAAVIRKTQSVPVQKEELSYELYEKEKSYKEMLELWMTLRERGVSFERYLAGQGMRRIAIYGGGILGRHLYEELKGSSIQAVCILDQNQNAGVPGVQTLVPGEEMEPVDAVIVTPFMEYRQIKNRLEGWYSCSIISIETVLFNADHELAVE